MTLIQPRLTSSRPCPTGEGCSRICGVVYAVITALGRIRVQWANGDCGLRDQTLLTLHVWPHVAPNQPLVLPSPKPAAAQSRAFGYEVQTEAQSGLL